MCERPEHTVTGFFGSTARTVTHTSGKGGAEKGVFVWVPTTLKLFSY